MYILKRRGLRSTPAWVDIYILYPIKISHQTQTWSICIMLLKSIIANNERVSHTRKGINLTRFRYKYDAKSCFASKDVLFSLNDQEEGCLRRTRGSPEGC